MILQWANLHIGRRNLPVWCRGVVMNDKLPYLQLTPKCKLCIIAKPCNAFLTLGEIFISASCPFKPEAKQLMLKPLQWYSTFKDPNLICPLLPLFSCCSGSYTFIAACCFPSYISLRMQNLHFSSLACKFHTKTSYCLQFERHPFPHCTHGSCHALLDLLGGCA